MITSRIAEWILMGLAIFLTLDAALALVLGKRYMLWGLDYTPAVYRALIKRMSESSPPILWGIKLAEGTIGIALFWIARRLIQ
jgi:hypothetical protein